LGVEELEKNYSPNWYEVYRAAGLPRRRWPDADRAWRAHYAKHRPKLIAGARRVLARLGRAHPLGLVTSGDRDRVSRQLREFRLTTLFAARVCSGDTLRKNRIRNRCAWPCSRWKLHPSACVYVGDAPQDVEMAKRAGVRAIGVLRPVSHGKAFARGPTGISDRFDRGIAGRSEKIAPLMNRIS